MERMEYKVTRLDGDGDVFMLELLSPTKGHQCYMVWNDLELLSACVALNSGGYKAINDWTKI